MTQFAFILLVCSVFANLVNAVQVELLLILNNDVPCNGCSNPIFAYPLTIDTNSSLSLTINVTDPVSNVLYSTIPYFDSSTSSLNDGVAAPPTAGTGAGQFLIAHARNGLVEYHTVVVNSTTSSLYLGDPKPDVSAYLPGIGQYPLFMKYLFHMDNLQSYYGLSYVNEIDEKKSTSALHIYFWKDIDQYAATPEPVYTYERTVPYCSGEFGVVGGSPAIDQAAGIVYINVAFWQSCDPSYNSGWLLAYNTVNNSVAKAVNYPNNVAPYLDWWIETVWSAKRKRMYSAIFYDWYSIIVDIVDVHTGANKTIISGSQWGTSMDGYNSKQLFDDFTGNWFILTDNEYVSVDQGLPWNLYVINVDMATISPVNTFIAPDNVLAFALNGHVAAAKAKEHVKHSKKSSLRDSKSLQRAVAVRSKMTSVVSE